MMNLLFLEPFYGGSHRNFACGLKASSRHDIDLVTLQARFWKWRMRGAALHFLEELVDFSRYDGVMTTDMLDLTDLMALGTLRMKKEKNGGFPPVVVYFHENQLTYPLPPGGKRDYQYGMTNMTTGLAARSVLFNSHSHRDAFLQALTDLMRRMPDARVPWVVREIAEKSRVIYPGCQVEVPGFLEGDHLLEDAPAIADSRNPKSPLIVWNHRWEFDKQPDVFFGALKEMQQDGVPFRLALLGERYSEVPDVFKDARGWFRDEMVHSDFVKDRRAYLEWLKKADLVVSTAIQENFGISTVEAVLCGALPLLPHRLSYPEIILECFHKDVLYDTFDDLVMKLKDRLRSMGRFQGTRQALSQAMRRFEWKRMISQYDLFFDEVFGKA